MCKTSFASLSSPTVECFLKSVRWKFKREIQENYQPSVLALSSCAMTFNVQIIFSPISWPYIRRSVCVRTLIVSNSSWWHPWGSANTDNESQDKYAQNYFEPVQIQSF